MPFQIFRDSVAGAVTVDDAAVARAFELALFEAKLLLEPSGAVALAAAMGPALAGRYRDIGVILTGGNVPAEVVADLVQASLRGETSGG